MTAADESVRAECFSFKDIEQACMWAEVSEAQVESIRLSLNRRTGADPATQAARSSAPAAPEGWVQVAWAEFVPESGDVIGVSLERDESSPWEWLPLYRSSAPQPPAESEQAPAMRRGPAYTPERLKGKYLLMNNADGEFGQATGWLYTPADDFYEDGTPAWVWRPLSGLIDLAAQAKTLRSALHCMLTFFGMDEEDHSKAVFDQARRALAATEPATPLAGQQGELDAILSFLFGEAAYDGVWFGEKHPTIKGSFWWRTPLRAALTQRGRGD